MSTETRTFRVSAGGRMLPSILIFSGIAFASMLGLNTQDQDGFQPTTPPSMVRTEGRIIDRIEFEGLQSVDPAYALSIVRITPGTIWDRDEIAAACARLSATNKFVGNPYAEPREEADGRLTLVFFVEERPFVVEVDFVGNEKFDADELLKAIPISAGSPISEFFINQSKDDIERKYREAGYYHVSVEVDRDVLENERRVLFRISEGPRIKVRRIQFEGNDSFSSRELKGKIETATYIWLFRTGAFSDETAERDVATLKQFYVDRGYLNAQVGYRIAFPENESKLTVIFQIEEGIQHLVKSVTFEGNTVYDDATLEYLMRTHVDGPIDADVLEKDRKAILEEYGRLGYIYAEIATTHLFDEEDGYVNLIVRINEGEQFRFGRINIRGNRNTKDKVIRRELRFYPEELYDTTATQRAERRIVETGLFTEATITPQGTAPGMRDAYVEVTEGNTTNILFGVGVSSNSGLVGSISVEQKNFDIFDWPRSAKEFFKGRSFRGAGQTLRFQIEPGTELTRASIEFREPYLMDKEIGLGVGAYAFERGREEYDERRIGFYTSFDKRWREGPLADWATEIAFKFENVDIDEEDIFTAPEIREDSGSNWLTSIKGTLVHDTTDSRWMPSEGHRFKVAWEQFGAMGGDHMFGRATASFDKHWTVHRDTFERKHIVQLGVSGGQIFGDAPVFEKFHGGGLGSVRGFEFRGISPRAGWRSDRVGGDFMLLTNAQYSYPLVGETIRGVTFLDMGTVEEDFGINSWRASVGVGLRIYVQYLGPIPLSFDLAFPIAEDDDDDTQIFSFSFGTTF